MLSKIVPQNSRYYYRFVLGIIFVLVGFIISFISIFTSGYYQIDAIHKESGSSAKSTLEHKQNFLFRQTNNFKNYLTAVDTTPEFKSLIQLNSNDKSHEKKHITKIMLAVSHSNQNIMQFRFIDKSGFEIIRIEKDSIESLPYIIDEKHLQNKAERYYFKEAKKTKEDNLWFSNLDLNIEHEKIVKPIVPTLRVAKPCYSNGEFKGILIINIFMEKILEEIMESDLFNIAIIDKDHYLLVNNLKDYEKGKNEWTRYLEESKNIKYTITQEKYDFPLSLLFEKRYFELSLSNIIQNGEGLKIVIEEKTQKLIEQIQDIKNYIIVMSLIIFLISFPIAMILSRYPIRLHDEQKKIKDDLEKQLDIIDKYVYMVDTDIKGTIVGTSTAYAKFTGYTKDELIGKDFTLFRDPSVPASFYKKLWVTILNGKKWTGEIANINKNGEKFFLRSHITPKIKNKKIIGFTSIKENITYQKLLEEMSIKDELTQTYNRRFFNQMFSKELNRAKRENSMFCVAMLDIDYFKKYNDTYGHIKGDEVLQKVVLAISDKLKRPSDYLFRVGGEEFIVTYSGVQSEEEAVAFASILVDAVPNLKIEHKESECSKFVTISLGLLSISPTCTMDEDAILQRIDNLLYQAKDAGRNQLVSEQC